jgi:hypothetical protein
LAWLAHLVHKEFQAHLARQEARLVLRVRLVRLGQLDLAVQRAQQASTVSPVRKV